MIEVKTLRRVAPEEIRSLASGYVSAFRYNIRKAETPERTVISLELAALEPPYVRHFEHESATLEAYGRVVKQGFSLGAYAEERLIGIALAEPHRWNRSLWVHEFHVDAPHRGRGIGRQMMEALADRARAADLRVLVCETQNTNVPAIAFYRAVGFEMEGVDLSYYTNEDMTQGEVAIFMKRKLTGPEKALRIR
jgi:ribosomal protein S18 acetylase RimI-like enzyme